MARFLKYIVPPSIGTEICILQSVIGAGSLIINGSLSNGVTQTASFAENGYCRNLSFISANNLSAVTFTITGTQNGVTITENVIGPNNNSVYSGQLYDTVTSITTSGAVNAVSVGSGFIGTFLFVPIDRYLTPVSYNLTVSLPASNPNLPTFTIYGSDDKITYNGSTYLQNFESGTLLIASEVTMNVVVDTPSYFSYPFSNTQTNGDQFAPYIPLLSGIMVSFAGAANTLGNTITLVFRQS